MEMRKTVASIYICIFSACFISSGQQVISSKSADNLEAVGKNKIELENDFIATIVPGSGSGVTFDSEGYVNSGGSFYVRKGDEYYIPQVRNDSYAVYKGGKLSPLASSRYPEESVMTIFTEPSASAGYSVELTLHKYGYVEQTFEVNLADFLISCRNDGCIPYVGIDECGKENIVASVFLVNSRKGYNHIMKANVGLDLLKQAKGLIKADLHVYVPTKNISNLFAE